MTTATTRSRLLAAALALTVIACGGEEGDGQSSAADGQSNDDAPQDEGDSDTGEAPPPPGDSCVDTPFIRTAPATFTASLRDMTPDPQGIGLACGITGPGMFLRVRVPKRADLTIAAQGHSYVPRVAVLAPGCIAEALDPSRLLACAEQLPITLEDLGPDRELLLHVGVDEAEPALALPLPEDPAALDPLEFRLTLSLRSVLEEGEQCLPAYGRCEAGTVCMAVIEGDPGEEIEVLRCVRPPADSCVAPGELVLPAIGEAPLLLELSPDEPHSDAHEHACTGWRRPERVDRLLLPDALPDDARLRVRVDDPRVGLALRAPSCLLEDARACAPANVAGAVETVLEWGAPGELAELAELGTMPYLFVELAREDPQPITVSLELLQE